VSGRRVLAVAARVLAQLRRDGRTVALLIVVPVVLVALFRWMLDGRPALFDRIGAPLVGIFPLISLFLVTSITMLRERTSGTLERLMTMPVGRLDLLGGYGLAFGAVAAVQGTVVAAVAIGALGLDVAGSPLTVVLLAVANALLGMALGLLVSAFAATEFQAVQFMPAVILPQLLLCGIIVPVEEMAPPLEALARVLPMTYAYDALSRAATQEAVTAGLVRDAAVVLGVAALAVGLGAATLRRRTP
jgi:ABC-2 type transport system permease protein